MYLVLFSIFVLCLLFDIGYVLMQRIFPSSQNTAFLRNGKLEVLPSISELGIYGTFVGYGASSSSSLSAVPTEATAIESLAAVAGAATTASDILSPILNNYGGYLVRTKPLGVDEGGVATGYSVINSIVLE